MSFEYDETLHGPLDVLQVFVGRLETGNTVNIKQFSGKYFEKSS